jgi:thiol-disulfide isomerase/thioredoxin
MKKLLGLLCLGASVVCAQSINGVWDAVINVKDYEVPFRMEFSQQGSAVTGSFQDGDLKVGSTSGQLENGNLHLRYDYYNADLQAALNDGKLEGTFTKKGRTGLTTYKFRAARFQPAAAPDENAPSIAGEWTIRAETNNNRPNAWRLILRQSGAEVTGAILRLDGDTGTLSGKFHDGKLVLSHFSAARPALVEATLNADGTLDGIMNRTTKFVAARASEAGAKGLKEPPDPSRYTSVKDPSEPFHFSFADVEGKTVSETDAQFRGKVVIVNIMGSWCPNCHDETPFLVELYAKYHAQGLEIVGLAFEALGNLDEDRTQVRAFVRRHGITYPILIAGQSETGAVPKTLPQIANFDAYPTSFFLGRDGRVKSVHAGFASPATGAENLRLKREVEDTVKKLLAEKAPELNTRLN